MTEPGQEASADGRCVHALSFSPSQGGPQGERLYLGPGMAQGTRTRKALPRPTLPPQAVAGGEPWAVVATLLHTWHLSGPVTAALAPVGHGSSVSRGGPPEPSGDGRPLPASQPCGPVLAPQESRWPRGEQDRPEGGRQLQPVGKQPSGMLRPLRQSGAPQAAGSRACPYHSGCASPVRPHPAISPPPGPRGLRLHFPSQSPTCGMHWKDRGQVTRCRATGTEATCEHTLRTQP